MKRVILAAALIIAGAIGLAIVAIFPLTPFTLVLAVIYGILFIFGLILGLSAVFDDDRHHDDC
jgi:disulfide bond formation protein DsbB